MTEHVPAAVQQAIDRHEERTERRLAAAEYTEPYQSREGGWFRTGRTPGHAWIVHMLSREDPTYTGRREYHADCASCWLGHAHSELLHRNQISTAAARREVPRNG